MHRIDGPGATVDNRFTDGDPVGGIQATMVTDDWANDVQEEIMSVLAAAAIAPVKGTQNQLLKAIRSVSTGVVGAATNVRMNAGGSASATLIADEIIVGTALGAQTYRIASFFKVVNLATTGAGGMDTGTAPVSGYVALYAIFNATSGTSALLAVNGTLGVMPAIYGGANMPAGYTASALLTVVPTTASGQFKTCLVRGRSITFTLINVYTATSTLITTNVNVSAGIPPNAIKINGEIAFQSSSASNMALNIYADAATLAGQQALSGTLSAGSSLTGNYSGVMIVTPQFVAVSSVATGAGPTFNIYVGGYEI